MIILTKNNLDVLGWDRMYCVCVPYCNSDSAYTRVYVQSLFCLFNWVFHWLQLSVILQIWINLLQIYLLQYLTYLLNLL